MLPSSVLSARDASRWDVWMFHDFQPSMTFDIAKVQPGLSLEDLIRDSQNYQAQLTRFATGSELNPKAFADEFSK